MANQDCYYVRRIYEIQHCISSILGFYQFGQIKRLEMNANEVLNISRPNEFCSY